MLTAGPLVTARMSLLVIVASPAFVRAVLTAGRTTPDTISSDGGRGVERVEAVVRDDDDVALGHAVGVRADQIQDLLHGIVGVLVGRLDVGGVLGHLRIGGEVGRAAEGRADRVRVGRVDGLPLVGQQVLVLQAVRLLDVDHAEARAGRLLHGEHTQPRLVIDEPLGGGVVDRLQFGVAERRERRRQVLDDAEVVPVRPETDVVVDVVHVLDHGQVARDEVGGVAPRWMVSVLAASVVQNSGSNLLTKKPVPTRLLLPSR